MCLQCSPVGAPSCSALYFLLPPVLPPDTSVVRRDNVPQYTLTTQAASDLGASGWGLLGGFLFVTMFEGKAVLAEEGYFTIKRPATFFCVFYDLTDSFLQAVGSEHELFPWTEYLWPGRAR